MFPYSKKGYGTRIISPPVTPPTRYLGNIQKYPGGNITHFFFNCHISRSLGRDSCQQNTDREGSIDRYIQLCDVRWNAPMSGLGPFKSVRQSARPERGPKPSIGTFYHTSAGTLLRSSLAGL